jgi:ubiquinone/menaquinone biosynthesis C-methylase UbiE
MAANDSQQRELVERIDLPERGLLCEVGFGPGALLYLLGRRFRDARLYGVDPSAVMLGQARRRLTSGWTEHDADVRLGAVGRLPFDNAAFNLTVSVNTVVLWPDLGVGLSEMARVTRPQGQVLLAWHGGGRPSRIQ